MGHCTYLFRELLDRISCAGQFLIMHKAYRPYGLFFAYLFEAMAEIPMVESLKAEAADAEAEFLSVLE